MIETRGDHQRCAAAVVLILDMRAPFDQHPDQCDAFIFRHLVGVSRRPHQYGEAVGISGINVYALRQKRLDNALERGDAALTGPVSRGDATTVSRHLVELSQESEQLAEVYRTLARRTAERALAAGTLSPDDAQRLLAVLAGPAGST